MAKAAEMFSYPNESFSLLSPCAGWGSGEEEENFPPQRYSPILATSVEEIRRQERVRNSQNSEYSEILSNISNAYSEKKNQQYKTFQFKLIPGTLRGT